MSWVRSPATVRAGIVGQLLVGEAGLLGVEPEHRPLLHRLGDLVGHGAEVLADDRRAGARRLGGDHGEQLRARVAHVHAFARIHPVGDPPQPVDTEDVVDAQHRGVLPAPPHDLAPQREPAAFGRPGSCGGNPQFCPSGYIVSGGAPTPIPAANRSAWAHVSNPSGWLPIGRSRANAAVPESCNRDERDVGEVLGELVARLDDIARDGRRRSSRRRPWRGTGRTRRRPGSPRPTARTSAASSPGSWPTASSSWVRRRRPSARQSMSCADVAAPAPRAARRRRGTPRSSAAG